MPELPKNISRYKILELLGKGAMGMVYKAMDPNIDRLVAIKAIRQSEFDDAPDGEEMVQRFKREIQTAGLLTHSNIVTIFDGGLDGKLHWIAMEYIDGPSLHKLVADKHDFSLHDIVTIMVKICSAMDFAHRRQVIHRDIKPANILMTSDWEPKIADFGIARVESSTMTKTGIILGTPSYMSPEQVTGQKIDSRSDLFSLGIVLYELVVGERPFTGDNPTTIMYKIVHNDAVSPRDLNPSLPQHLSDIIMKAMQKRPRERYSTAGEMAKDLLKLTGEEDISISSARMTMETAAIDSQGLAESFDSYRGIESVDGDSREGEAKSPLGKVLITIFIILLLTAAGYGGWWYYDNYISSPNETPIPAATLEKTIELTTQPETGTVYINGVERGKSDGSAIVLKGELNTPFDVTISSDCYEDITDTIILDNNQQLERSYPLQPKIRSIQIITEPEEAVIVVNDNGESPAPYQFDMTCTETYKLKVKAEDYYEKEIDLGWKDINEDGTYTVVLDAINYGTLNLSGAYQATVTTSRGSVLARNTDSLRLKPGSYTLNFKNKEFFLNITREITIEEGQQTNLNLPELATLSIFALPAQCTVEVSGFTLGPREMPMRQRKVVSGTHRVVFRWGDEKKEITTTLAPGGEERVQGKLN